MNKIKASIVIPTKDKLTRLRLVLKALEAQVDESVEVILVFDGCTRETLEAFHALRFTFQPVKVVCRHNVGRAAARNRGIKQAKGDIIIFLDDDRIPAPDFVKRHMERHTEPCVILGGRFDLLFTEKEIAGLYDNDALKSKLSHVIGNAKKENIWRSPIPWLNFFTGNVSVEKAHLEAVGMFDENFVRWGLEDVDLGIRLHKKGLPFKLDGSIANWHLTHDSNFSHSKRQEFLENMRYLIQKNRKDFFVSSILRVFYYKVKLIGMLKPNYEKDFKKNLTQDM